MTNTESKAGPAAQQDPPKSPTATKQEKTVSNATSLNVAVAPRKDSERWEQLDPVTWEGLLDWLDLEHPADHRECGGYVPGLFRDQKRDDDHLVSRSVLTLDADKAGPTFLEDVARVLPGTAWAAHTTWRHQAEGHGDRYRLLAPLSRPLDGAQYRRVTEAVRGALGQHWGADKGCPSPVQFMYQPSTQGGYVHRVAEGGPLDVDRWLLHRYAAAAIESDLLLLDLAQDGERNSTTFKVACNLIEFANSPWSGYTRERAEDDLAEYAPVSDGFDEAEVAGCWESALQRVGDRGRPEPGGEGPKADRVDVTNAAEAADWLLAEVGRGQLAGLFRRGGELVHTPRINEDGYVPLSEKGEDGPAQVRPVDAGRLRSLVQFSYPVAKLSAKGKWSPATFPVDSALLVSNAVERAPGLRPLAGVTHTPMLRRDGTVLFAEGYDTASARLYLPEHGMATPLVPDQPTDVEVKAARDLVDEMIAGFDFVTDHDRANYLALLLTPLLRAVVPPPYPLGLLHAHQPGSGKGLLAWILRTLHGGALRPLPESGSEFRKTITSILSVTTAPVVQFDNVHKLSSSQLDALLTTDTWSDRPLGATDDRSLKNDRLWVATGNNVALGGDLLRRVRWVSIDPKVPNPEQRTDFAIADLKGWVRDRRGELLGALLTLLRAWVVAGRPQGPRVGSDDFAPWTHVLQGVLLVAGWTGTVSHQETVQQESTDEDTEWAAFLAEAFRLFGNEKWTTKDLVGRIDLDYDALPGGMDVSSARSVGKWLRNRQGRWADGYTVRMSVDKALNANVWRVEQS